MMRVLIVGCGKIADQHVHAIHRISDAAVVAVCDQEPLMAGQLANRLGIPRAGADLGQLLDECRPTAVHITTPPQSHFALASQCIAAGAHVYLEKPFTITAEEAVALYDQAAARGVVLVAGHNLQFTPEMIEMRRLVTEDYLGGPPVHLESHFSYDLEDASYVAPMLGSKGHWVRRLPGQLLQNLCSHGVARLAEFLSGELEQISVIAFQSSRFRELGGAEVLDELRVLLKDSQGTTASFCFSTQIKPGVNRFAIYGPRNSVEVDLSSGTVIRKVGRSYKSYLTFLGPPLDHALQHSRNAWRNATAIATTRLYQDSGMTELIRRFFESIRSGGAVPTPSREVILTAKILDEICLRAYGSAGRVQTDQALVVSSNK